MADYNLAIHGAKQVLTADGAGPLSIVIATVKPASSIVLATISERRRQIKVQRGVLSAIEASTSPVNDALATAVGNLGQAYVNSSVRETRAGNSRGATVKLSGLNEVRLEWLGGALAAGEEIQAEYEVVEPILRRAGARAYLIDATHIGIAWDGGALEADEAIDVRYSIFDLESIGDDLKEIIYRGNRALGYLGENLIQDLPTFDDAGNPVTYRLRVFDTKANAEACTLHKAAESAFDTGELSRVNVTADYSFPKGDIKSRTFILEDKIAAPGVN